MLYRKSGLDYIVRLEKGEEICSSLLRFAEMENILSASVTGIGATDDFTVGIYEPARKAYDPIHVTGDHEITALTGNLTRKDGCAYQHLHITCAGLGGTVTGGHLVSGTVSLTAEIFVHASELRAERRRDDALGINLIAFDAD